MESRIYVMVITEVVSSVQVVSTLISRNIHWL